MTLKDLLVTYRILFELMCTYDVSSAAAANLIESRRLVEGELWAMGWDGNDEDDQ